MRTEKTYNVLNYSTSPVSIAINRYDNVLVEGSTDGEPTIYPLTIDEIIYVNNATKAIKCGLLRFEECDQEELYNVCRIKNWQEILTNEQIEYILTHPNMENMQQILDIKDSVYFNRIYGTFIGLRNSGTGLSSKIEQIMALRYRELANGQTKTNVVISPTTNSSATDERDAKIKNLEQELAQLKATMQQISTSQIASTDESASVTAVEEFPEKKVVKKPSTAKSNKTKTTTNKNTK